MSLADKNKAKGKWSKDVMEWMKPISATQPATFEVGLYLLLLLRIFFKTRLLTEHPASTVHKTRRATIQVEQDKQKENEKAEVLHRQNLWDTLNE